MDGLGIVPYMFGMLGQCFPLEVLLGGWRQAQAHPDGLKKPGLVACHAGPACAWQMSKRMFGPARHGQLGTSVEAVVGASSDAVDGASHNQTNNHELRRASVNKAVMKQILPTGICPLISLPSGKSWQVMASPSLSSTLRTECQ